MKTKNIFICFFILLLIGFSSSWFVVCGEDSPQTKATNVKPNEKTRESAKASFDSSDQDPIQRIHKDFLNEKGPDDNTVNEKRPHQYILYVVAIVVAVLVLLAILFHPTKKKPEDANNELRCPRCGTSYNPGETICRQCKLHF